MLVFLTSIRHPTNSNSFQKVEELFELSLRSVCSQTDANFRVIVVCNSLPRIGFNDPRVVYHVVDFPAPSAERRASIDFVAHLRDKGTKYISGLLLARQFAPDYICIFDADDWVSRKIAEYANSRPNTAGWYVDAGYAVNYRTQRIQRKHGLVRYCGTTLLPNAANLYQCSRMLDMHVTERSSQQDILASFPRYFIECVLGDHKYFVAYFARNGFRMRPLPFRATAWIQETGENHTMTSGSRTGVPITTAFRKEFGIEEFGARVSPPTVAESCSELLGCLQSRLGFMRMKFFGFPAPPGGSWDPSPRSPDRSWSSEMQRIT